MTATKSQFSTCVQGIYHGIMVFFLIKNKKIPILVPLAMNITL